MTLPTTCYTLAFSEVVAVPFVLFFSPSHMIGAS